MAWLPTRSLTSNALRGVVADINLTSISTIINPSLRLSLREQYPIRQKIEISPSHSLMACSLVSDAAIAGWTPARLLSRLGIKFSSGSPCWHYAIGRIAFEIASGCPKAIGLLEGKEGKNT